MVDAGLTVLFVHILGVHRLAGRGVGFLAASVFCWWLNRQWTFAVAHPPQGREYVRYLVLNLLAGAVNITVYRAMLPLDGTAVHVLCSVAVGTLAGLMVNYAGMKYHLFKR